MLLLIRKQLCFSISKSPFILSPFFTRPPPRLAANFQSCSKTLTLGTFQRSISHTATAMDPYRPTIPHPDDAGRTEMFRALEASLGSTFSSKPLIPNPNPLIIVVSGPSGVGKDAVIKRLREVRNDLHFVVTATSRPKRDGEVEGKDYFFLTKDDFLSMIDRNELLEYALVYGDYKGIPKQQIREYMAKGCDIVLRVDIQGAATLRRILRNSAVFVFLAAESEEALVKRLIARKTESIESLHMRVASAKEELRHLNEFDYVVVNKEGELDNSVQLMESIIDAEKARVQQRRAVI